MDTICYRPPVQKDFLVIRKVLKGQSTLRLQDYVTLRSIAVFESVFMKARIAAADLETQISMMRKLIWTERVILRAVRPASPTKTPSFRCSYGKLGTERSALFPTPRDLSSKGHSSFLHFAENVCNVHQAGIPGFNSLCPLERY